MVICNNRKKCGTKICNHSFLHKEEYCDYFKPKECSGFNCSSKCGQKRECVDEFIDIVRKELE